MTSPITDTAPRYSPWSIPHHDPHPHSSGPTSSPDLTDTPVTKLLPVTGGQFQKAQS